MKSHLKVKVFALAAEMTYIRRQEEKWKTRAKYNRQRQKVLSDPTKIKKAVSSLSYAERAFWSHRDHRDSLKTDARSSHLAYGCLRGVPYSRMEGMCYGPLKGYGSSEPDWKHIESMVEKFSKDEDSPQLFMQSFSEWLEAAKVWYEANPERIKNWQAQRKLDYQAKLADPVYQQRLAERRDFMRIMNTPVKL